MQIEYTSIVAIRSKMTKLMKQEAERRLQVTNGHRMICNRTVRVGYGQLTKIGNTMMNLDPIFRRHGIGIFSQCCFLIFAFSTIDSWAGDCSPKSAVIAAKQFMSAIDRAQIFSVPKRNELSKISRYVTPELYSLLKQASQAEEREFTRSKGKEPPLYEGSLFSSLAEGYTSYTITPHTLNEVSINFEYIGKAPDTNKSYIWIDFMMVQEVSSKCLVSDMIFDNGNSGTVLLSKILKDISGN